MRWRSVQGDAAFPSFMICWCRDDEQPDELQPCCNKGCERSAMHSDTKKSLYLRTWVSWRITSTCEGLRMVKASKMWRSGFIAGHRMHELEIVGCYSMVWHSWKEKSFLIYKRHSLKIHKMWWWHSCLTGYSLQALWIKWLPASMGIQPKDRAKRPSHSA